MKVNNFFSNKQYRFIKGRSTVLQLVKILDSWVKTLDMGGCIDVVYCDFMKAFDKVPHRRLLQKLEYYGVSNPIIGWIRNLVFDRKQRVIVNGQSSDWQ